MAQSQEQLIKQLRKQLQQATLERDELQRDVENLCLTTSGSMWDGSSFVLSERLFSSEAEVRQLKRDMLELSEERDTYSEQAVEVKKAKSIMDNSYRELLTKSQKLEQELGFYQTQSALAMADRERMSAELDELHSSNLELQRQARDFKESSESERAQRMATAKELARHQQQLQQASRDLEDKMAEAAVIPDLQRRISALEAQRAALAVTKQQLEVRGRQEQSSVVRWRALACGCCAVCYGDRSSMSDPMFADGSQQCMPAGGIWCCYHARLRWHMLISSHKHSQAPIFVSRMAVSCAVVCFLRGLIAWLLLLPCRRSWQQPTAALAPSALTRHSWNSRWRA
jgi:hypothetical protein